MPQIVTTKKKNSICAKKCLFKFCLGKLTAFWKNKMIIKGRALLSQSF